MYQCIVILSIYNIYVFRTAGEKAIFNILTLAHQLAATAIATAAAQMQRHAIFY